MVNNLHNRLRQRRLQLLDTYVFGQVLGGTGSPVKFGATGLVCCPTLLRHTRKVSEKFHLIGYIYTAKYLLFLQQRRNSKGSDGYELFGIYCKLLPVRMCRFYTISMLSRFGGDDEDVQGLEGEGAICAGH
ncbi:hypothetical protein YC2023_102495 [Brassica napus]